MSIDLKPHDREENNAKCFICSAGLSYVDHFLYGNRCQFCAEKKKRVSLLRFLLHAVYDWRIHRAASHLDRVLLHGCLGFVGIPDINRIKTIRGKRELLKVIRRPKETPVSQEKINLWPVKP